jgi:hypothetical protein
MAMVVGDNGDEDVNKNYTSIVGHFGRHLMWIRWCDAGHMAQWSTPQASLEATGCRHHQVSDCAVSPRLPAGTMVMEIGEKHTNTNKTQLLASNYYSAHRCHKLRKNVRHHDWS